MEYLQDGQVKGKGSSEEMAQGGSIVTKRGGMKRPAAAIEVEQELGRRDRMAQYYMLQRFDELPESCQKLFEEARKNGNRKEQTRIVNNVMKKKGSTYEIDLASPIFTELAVKFEKKWGSHKDKAYVKAVAETLVGGHDNLKKAFADGESRETTGEDGKRYFVFSQLEAGRSWGSCSSKEVKTSNNVAKEEASKMMAMIESLQWAFTFNKKEQIAAEKGEGLPAIALEKLGLASSSAGKLIKSLSDAIVKMKPHLAHGLVKNGFDKLSKHISAVRKYVSTLETIKLLGTMDDGSDADCKAVLKVLGEVAAAMDAALTDMNASTGLISGIKRS
jgi:hypothetical protein